eukprot:402713_1
MTHTSQTAPHFQAPMFPQLVLPPPPQPPPKPIVLTDKQIVQRFVEIQTQNPFHLRVKTQHMLPVCINWDKLQKMAHNQDHRHKTPKEIQRTKESKKYASLPETDTTETDHLLVYSKALSSIKYSLAYLVVENHRV